MSEKACREPARSSTSSASTSSDDSEESLLSDVDETLPSQAAFDVFALLGDAQRNRAEWCVASRKAARWIASWAVCHVLFRTDTSQELLLRAFIQLEADLVTAKVSQVNSIAWPILVRLYRNLELSLEAFAIAELPKFQARAAATLRQIFKTSTIRRQLFALDFDWADSSVADTGGLVDHIECLLLAPRLAALRLEGTRARLAQLRPLIEWYARHAAIGDVEGYVAQVMGGVRHLNLADTGLRYLPRHFVQDFPNLQSLDVRHNQLDSLPSTICASKIKLLLCEGNRFRPTWNHSKPMAAHRGPTSLLHQCLVVLLRRFDQDDRPDLLALPPHLQRKLAGSFLCQSCSRLVTPEVGSPRYQRARYLEQLVTLRYEHCSRCRAV